MRQVFPSPAVRLALKPILSPAGGLCAVRSPFSGHVVKSHELQKSCVGYALGEQLAVDQSFEPVVADECCKARLSP